MAGCQNTAQLSQCADLSLFSQIITFENLHRAALKAQKGKRHRHEVAAFFAHLEENLIELQNELIWHQYETGVYRKQLQNKTMTISDIRQRLQSWIGHCKHCHSYRLRINLLMRLRHV